MPDTMSAHITSPSSNWVQPKYQVSDTVIVKALSASTEFNVIGLAYSKDHKNFVYTLSPAGQLTTISVHVEEHPLNRKRDNESETQRELTLGEQYHEDMRQNVLKGIKGVIEEIIDDDGLVVVSDSDGLRQYEGVALTRRTPDYVDAGYKLTALDEARNIHIQDAQQVELWVRAPTLGGDESDKRRAGQERPA
jgi:hypothetical protein